MSSLTAPVDAAAAAAAAAAPAGTSSTVQPQSATGTPSAAPSPTPIATPADMMDFSPSTEPALSRSALQSQPMTATASNSSEHPSQTNLDASGATAYGTRSRNRTSGARPNYADDREIDLEIEAAGKLSKNTKKSTTAHAAVVTVQENETTPARQGFAAVNANTDGSTTSPAPAPGSGVYNTLPPPQPSKKRKQPGSSTTVNPVQSNPTRTRPPAPASAPTLPKRGVESNMMSFDRCRSRLNAKGQLVDDEGTTIQPNDHLYFVCEPPGEPYYLARVMEFLHVNNDTANPVDAIRVNWYYRPKDIQRRVQDTRVVFASMHSDTCPLTSIRGKCTIKHLSSVQNVDEYRKLRDSFWFDKLYDRYMHRYYEVIPTEKVVNVPKHVKKVLDERWKFVLVEVGRGRDLTTAGKMCKRCGDFAANHNSVDCAVCKNTYHMHCVRPPLLKKPARGFAWACAVCSRAQEMKLEARNTPNTSDGAVFDELEDELPDDDDEEEQLSRDQITRENSAGVESHPPPSAAQLAQANLWPYRYLGIHSRPEDALDYDDRIYPRASSRLGPRHQANTNIWHGRPVEFVKAAEGKKKYKPTTATKKDAKMAAVDSDQREKRPKWVLDEPPGYVARGHDKAIDLKGKKEYTAQTIFKMPDPSKFTERGLDDVSPGNFEQIIDDYMAKCDKEIGTLYGFNVPSTDVRTKAIEKLHEHNYDPEKALESMRHLSIKTDLKLPDLNREEVKRFEEGVSKYGSELHLVARHISPTIKESRIVRFYYMWKKTPRGKEIWGNYEGRKSKRDSRRTEKDGTGAKLLDDVADDHDDSAFDNDKALKLKRGFLCKFCGATHSKQWRRAPGTAPGTLAPADPASKSAKDKSNWLTLSLCGKCAYLWRRYAIQYESIEEISRKIAAAGGRAAKRKIDEELMRTVIEAQYNAGDIITQNSAQMATSAGIEVPPAMVQSDEPPKKKPKVDKDTPEVVVEKKKVVPEKPVEQETLKPEAPRVKEHPCAVCHVMDDPQHKMFKCRDCRLHVHAACYGINPATITGPWFCDMCKNDHSTLVSTTYECVLCPVRVTPQELMEPPRATHKKKSDREREKERQERDMVQEAGRRWRQDQEAAGRPVNPREPLKRTAWNNWVHVNCAVWTKEIKFGDADGLDAAEGVGFIPPERFNTPCKICKQPGLPTVNCHFAACTSSFHIGCAHQAEYVFGFDIAPVKGTRRDSVAVMKLDQEAGLAQAAVWCPGHPIPTIIHGMLEIAPSGLTALQEFARTYKQVDTSVTGTVRRAAQFTHNLPTTALAVQAPVPRSSTTTGIPGSQPNGDRTTVLRTSPSPLSPSAEDSQAEPPAEAVVIESVRKVGGNALRKCCSCLVESSPRWWQVASTDSHSPPNTHIVGSSTQHVVDAPSSQVNGIPVGASPLNTHVLSVHSGLGPAQSTNGVVKAEPADVPPHDVPRVEDDHRFQCHKCHVQKRTPPSSPSQIRRKQKSLPEPVQEPVAFQSVYPPPPPGLYPTLRTPMDGPGHPHPGTNGVISHHSPWQGGPAQWSAPVIRNGNQVSAPPPPPPPPMYGNASVYRPGPPIPPHDYSRHYPQHPPHAGAYSSSPGLQPPPPPRPNGVLQHSPPAPPYAHPHHAQPPQPNSVLQQRPPSPGRYIDRQSISSTHPGLGSSSILSRPFIPEQGHRGAESPHPPYGAHPRGYQSSLPPPMARPPSAQSLAHIAQVASEQSGSSHSHSRQPSVDAMGTPRLTSVRSSGVPESPNFSNPRPVTPADGRDNRASVGPGPASASPSLKNLLS